MTTTYKINLEGHPSFTIMGEDMDVRDKPVAYCFLISETKENLEKVIT